MRIKYSPQVNDVYKINYTIEDETIAAVCNGFVNSYNLSLLCDDFYKESVFDGEIVIEAYIAETVFDFVPIINAYRDEAGELYVELLNFISNDASEEEKYPGWLEV
ncbi:MAG: hypothetical protein GYA50_06950 [Eubacteriaceae bacterium]|nr:hypothetical protein [Eubacteriaceae bacterium]